MTKKKTKAPKEVAEDITWCKNNVKVLKPKNYFKQFGFNNREFGHRRYRVIITTHLNKMYRKKLIEEFDLWRFGVDSSRFWKEQVKNKSRAEAELKDTEFATRRIQNVYDEMNCTFSESEEENTIPDDNDTDDDNNVNGVSFLSDDKHPDAECYYSCLQGKGSELWKPLSSNTNYPDWIINDKNVTNYFKQLRKESFSAALNLERISTVRILTLSHIFTIASTTERSVTNLIPELNDDLLLETDFFRRVETPLEIIQWAHELHEVQTGGIEKKLLKMKEYSLNSSNKLIQKHIAFLDDFMMFYRVPHNNDTEDNTLDRLKMILRHVFYDKKYVTNGNTKHLESSKIYIPDYKLSYLVRTTKLLDIFIVEAKLSHKAYFPHQDDFIKLQLEMQKMINELIFFNIKQPMVFGLLLTGLDCQLYSMWLKNDGVYICREIQTFSLPRSSYEVLLCPSILSTFLGLKDKIDNIVLNIQTREKGMSSLLALTREGYDMPVVVKDPLDFSKD